MIRSTLRLAFITLACLGVVIATAQERGCPNCRGQDVGANDTAGHSAGDQDAGGHDAGRRGGAAERHGSRANAHMHERDFAALIANFESPERMNWQRPGALLDSFGDLDGKTVADIRSGSGFLAFRMAERGARVPCVDVDERFLA
jgi:hypothetical protein